MGLAIRKPNQPVPVFVLATSGPFLYLRLLREIQRRIEHRYSPAVANSMEHVVKAVGASLFSVGHGLQCLRKPSLDYTDWSYIIACTPFLSGASLGNYIGKPFPSGLFSAGIFLYVAYVPLVLRAQKAGASTTLPFIGVAAASLLTWLGSILVLIKGKVISKSPGLQPLVYAQMTSSCFGTGNLIKLVQLLQQGSPCDWNMLGQVLKVTASCMLLTGNSLGLGWHRIKTPKGFLLFLAMAFSAAVVSLRTKTKLGGTTPCLPSAENSSESTTKDEEPVEPIKLNASSDRGSVEARSNQRLLGA